MSKMTILGVPAMIAALAATAAPAQAAPEMHRRDADRAQVHYAGFGQAINLKREIARLGTRIDHALARHRISWREAQGLRHDLRKIDRLFTRYSRGGLTRHEARTLEARIADLEQDLRIERRDREHRRG